MLLWVLSFINFEYQFLGMSSVAVQIGHVFYAESAFWKWLRSDQGQSRGLGGQGLEGRQQQRRGGTLGSKGVEPIGRRDCGDRMEMLNIWVT